MREKLIILQGHCMSDKCMSHTERKIFTIFVRKKHVKFVQRYIYKGENIYV